MMPIKAADFENLFITFVESGLSNFWCGLAEFKLVGADYSYQKVDLYEGKWSVTLHPAEDDDFEPITITAESFADAPPHPAIGRWLRDDSSFDANDADTIVQLAAFKKEVYG
jgi:hypothetical protein